MNLTERQLADFVKQEVIPLPDEFWGSRYRAAVYLVDGTFLPCVIFQSRQVRIQRFKSRMKVVKKEGDRDAVLGSYLCAGSQLASYQVKTIEHSRFAWPLEVLRQIRGETAMGWTAFVAEMRDGMMFSYGTAFTMEFFELPPRYTHSDISRIHSGMAYSKELGLVPFSLAVMKNSPPLRERAHFECYIDHLD